jgi:hypothetical protein
MKRIKKALFLFFLALFYILGFFESGSQHVAHSGLELTIELRLASNFSTSCLTIPSTDSIGMPYPMQQNDSLNT